MKAVVWTRYGPPDVLKYEEVPDPVPKADEIRIRVHTATVFAGDVEMRALKFSPGIALPLRIYVGLIRPGRIRILGQELAGVVESAGEAVTRFKAGDEVFGTTGFRFGAYAALCCLPQKAVLAVKPENVSFEEAAPVPVGGLEALHFTRMGGVREGTTVLINGAGGSIGTYSVQLAKHLGAEVTAVDRGEKLDMLRELGAGEVLDYTREDLTRLAPRFDVIFDVVGKGPVAGLVGLLKENGTFLVGNPQRVHRTLGRRLVRNSRRKIVLETAKPKTKDLVHLGDLLEQGAIRTVIDRRFPLAEAAEGHRYVETGQKLGHVILTID